MGSWQHTQSLLGALSYKTLFVSQGPNLGSKEIKRHGSFLKIGMLFLFGFETAMRNAMNVGMTRYFNVLQLAFNSNNHLPHTPVTTRDCETR